MVKVSDFGLSKCLSKEEYYYKLENKKRKLPLRWMSIEAIEHSIFSAKSDVVRLHLLYFIFSLVPEDLISNMSIQKLFLQLCALEIIK